jgi:hypothetical protein
VSRPAERARANGVPSAESHLELEELENEAILAHETSAHLPQKRAQVTEEARSIVISEPHATGQRPFKPDRGEPTMVVDRKDLEAARTKILQRSRRGSSRRRGLMWAALAAAAFIGGGLLVFFTTRAPGQPTLFAGATPVLGVAREQAPSTASSAGLAAQAEVERLPPKVSLEELPLERPRRRQ